MVSNSDSELINKLKDERDILSSSLVRKDEYINWLESLNARYWNAEDLVFRLKAEIEVLNEEIEHLTLLNSNLEKENL